MYKRCVCPIHQMHSELTPTPRPFVNSETVDVTSVGAFWRAGASFPVAFPHSCILYLSPYALPKIYVRLKPTNACTHLSVLPPRLIYDIKVLCFFFLHTLKKTWLLSREHHLARCQGVITNKKHARNINNIDTRPARKPQNYPDMINDRHGSIYVSSLCAANFSLFLLLLLLLLRFPSFTITVLQSVYSV